jgi:hypothetical protein
MKKLMIVAAVAAMTGAALADAQVYDVKLTVKTTTCKDGKFTKALENLGWFGGLEKGDEVSYRKQATLTLAGIIWGCDCDAIANPEWRVYGYKKGKYSVGGYAFWNATGKEAIALQIPFVKFDWAVLNRIDQMNTVEGTWMLGDAADGEALFFLGAGFGTVKNNTKAPQYDCLSYISSMKGNFAGFMQGGEGGDNGCIFCGTTAYDCLVAPFCVCANAFDSTEVSAAYGSWTIKYNSSASKKLKKAWYINDADGVKVVNFDTKKLADVDDALDAAWFAANAVANELDLANNLNLVADADDLEIEGVPTSKDLDDEPLVFEDTVIDVQSETFVDVYYYYVNDDYPGAVEFENNEVATALLELIVEAPEEPEEHDEEEE